MKPFKGMKIYYSGSIFGAKEEDKDLPWRIVRYMADNGADVLSEHVAGRTQEERDEILAKHVDKDVLESYKDLDFAVKVRLIDVNWVDQTDYIVALINAPSHGVGMEIERALLKPERGLPVTPILALYHEEKKDNLSRMITGITDENFYLESYKNFEDIQNHIDGFIETAELMKVPGLRESLKKADEEIANGEFYTLEEAFGDDE